MPSIGAGAAPQFGHDLSRFRISDPRSAAEQDAERAASDVMMGRPAQVRTAAPIGTLYRQPLPDFSNRPSPRLARLMGSELLDGFELDGSELTEDHKGRLAVLAFTLKSLLRDYPSGSVQVIGHTDASGGEEHNERLGQKRADAVSGFLLAAGVPPGALAAVSEGESDLRIKTSRPEPGNRRVQIRFEPEPRLRLGPGLELTPPSPPERKETPSFEDSCIVFPERCRRERRIGGFPVPDLPEKPPAEARVRCDSISDCSATSNQFDKLPPTLQDVLKASPLGLDAETWFRELGGERQSALRNIFNRLCRYGLWCHAKEILKIVPGEAHVTLRGVTFKAPGLTPSVHFMSPSGDALYTALMATGKFCTAYGTGASKHPGQTTLREISGSDSLHISIGSKTSDNEFDAHIDLYSPVLDPPGSSFCPNDPSAAALGHIGREVIPEMVRSLFGIPGFQFFPQPPPAPGPEGVAEMEPLRGSPSFSVGGVTSLLAQILLKISRVTLHGPIKKQQPLVSPESKRVSPDVKELAEQTAAKIAADLEQRVGPEALVPSRVKTRRREARRAAEFAGPGEEDRLNKARDEAEAAVSSYADPHEVGLELAARLALAQDIGRPYVTIELPFYGGLDAPDHKFLAGEILRMALIVRKHLPNKAADVHHIQVFFGRGKKRKSVVVDLP